MISTYPPYQQTNTYMMAQYTTGTLIPGVAGKKIVATFTGIVFGSGNNVIIYGNQNGSAGYLRFTTSGGGSVAVPVFAPDVEFDAGASVSLTYESGVTGYINAVYYLK